MIPRNPPTRSRTLFPTAVLVVAILSINLIGDTMRDRLDPRETRSLV